MLLLFFICIVLDIIRKRRLNDDHLTARDQHPYSLSPNAATSTITAATLLYHTNSTSEVPGRSAAKTSNSLLSLAHNTASSDRRTVPAPQSSNYSRGSPTPAPPTDGDRLSPLPLAVKYSSKESDVMSNALSCGCDTSVSMSSSRWTQFLPQENYSDYD